MVINPVGWFYNFSSNKSVLLFTIIWCLIFFLLFTLMQMFVFIKNIMVVNKNIIILANCENIRLKLGLLHN
jgi:hypothetical protein